jgi:hypothetical protein
MLHFNISTWGEVWVTGGTPTEKETNESRLLSRWENFVNWHKEARWKKVDHLWNVQKRKKVGLYDLCTFLLK